VAVLTDLTISAAAEGSVAAPWHVGLASLLSVLRRSFLARIFLGVRCWPGPICRQPFTIRSGNPVEGYVIGS
jgi:hypothetical protein